MTPTIITAHRLREFLFNLGIADEVTFTPAQRYALPALDWLFDSKTTSHLARIVRREIPKGYEKGPSVCYHFAGVVAQEIRRLHRVSENAPPGVDVSVARHEYVPFENQSGPVIDRSGHARVLVVGSLDKGATLLAAWMEPQNRTRADLVQAEILATTKCDFA